MFTVEICISSFYGTYQKVTYSNSVHSQIDEKNVLAHGTQNQGEMGELTTVNKRAWEPKLMGKFLLENICFWQ
jgi:hypothetical protein